MRYAPRHIVGTFAIDFVGERIAPASPLFRSANKTRATMLRAAQLMPRDDAALFMGLVIGDDRAQPRTMITSFRQSGLSHLTAVSGQNVAFVLTVFGVYINRARTWWRLGLTLFLLGWFVVVTRAEPSVLRATMMAAMSAIAFARGRDLPARKALLYSVVILLALDPLLILSIGFWMSSLATCGLIFVSPWLKQFLHGPKWINEPLATTLGAQLGVMPISLFIFSSAPAISLVTNLLAVPVAGFVMLIGLPIAFICGLLITLIGPAVYPLCMVAMLPVQCATRWVWWVAVVGERVSPHGVANALLWVVWGVFLVVLHRSARMHT
jgi:competence protein ComEC